MLVDNERSDDGRIVGRRDRQREGVGDAERAVARRDLEVDQAAEVRGRPAGESARRSIEREPTWQSCTADQRRPVGQAGVVHIRERARGNLERPGRVFRYRLIRDRRLTTGASFTGVIVSLKVSDALSEPSLAITLSSRVPLKS